MMTTKIDNVIDEYIKNELEENSFQDILEKYDLTPSEVFLHLFNSGLIDEQVFWEEHIVR